MELGSPQEMLSCTECGEEIEGAGYLPATETSGRYEPRADGAICDACGFNEVGMMGCAPELDEILDPGPEDVLLYVRRTDDGMDVLSAKK